MTQTEADALFAMPKVRVDETRHQFPTLGGCVAVPLASVDSRVSFSLDVTRGQLNLMKVSYQNRVRTTLILARLDLEGPPHQNPDGEEIDCPHIHLYRAGYDDKWAYPIHSDTFSNTSELLLTLTEFMVYCNVTEFPHFDSNLFV